MSEFTGEPGSLSSTRIFRLRVTQATDGNDSN
jgi:hypothetical protein